MQRPDRQPVGVEFTGVDGEGGFIERPVAVHWCNGGDISKPPAGGSVMKVTINWKRDGLVVWMPVKALLFVDKTAFCWIKEKLGLF